MAMRVLRHSCRLCSTSCSVPSCLAQHKIVCRFRRCAREHKTTWCAGMTKLQDANDAGTRLSEHCTLILTEGDSAKALVIDGLSVAGRDRFGVFPLRCLPSDRCHTTCRRAKSSVTLCKAVQPCFVLCWQQFDTRSAKSKCSCCAVAQSRSVLFDPCSFLADKVLASPGSYCQPAANCAPGDG